MYILGIHNGFDSGAALIKDGKPISCINEERLNRKKGYVGPPTLSIQAVLKMAGIHFDDIDIITQAGITAPLTHQSFSEVGFRQRFASCISYVPFIKKSKYLVSLYRYFSKKNRSDSEVNGILNNINIQKPIDFIDHHLCHAATAYFCSPFKASQNKVLVVTSDGSGDGLSSTISVIDKSKISVKHRVNSYNSIAVIYGYVTHNLGFKQHLHEGKITGLAAYGDASKTLSIFQKILFFNKKTEEPNNNLPGFGML